LLLYSQEDRSQSSDPQTTRRLGGLGSSSGSARARPRIPACRGRIPTPPGKGQMTEANVHLTWRRPAFKSTDKGGPRAPSAPTDRLLAHLSYRAATNNGRFITDWFPAFHSSPSISRRAVAAREQPVRRLSLLIAKARSRKASGRNCRVCALMSLAVCRLVRSGPNVRKACPSCGLSVAELRRCSDYVTDNPSRFVGFRQ
jgi:hypothetical protein